jgi:hypothetical protein
MGDRLGPPAAKGPQGKGPQGSVCESRHRILSTAPSAKAAAGQATGVSECADRTSGGLSQAVYAENRGFRGRTGTVGRITGAVERPNRTVGRFTGVVGGFSHMVKPASRAVE